MTEWVYRWFDLYRLLYFRIVIKYYKYKFYQEVEIVYIYIVTFKIVTNEH